MKSFKKGDIIRVIKDRHIFNDLVKKGDIAVALSSAYIRFVTGALAREWPENTQSCVTGLGGIEVVYSGSEPEPLEFKPFSIEISTRHEAEIFKAIMHVHNKVADCSFFALDWTPDKEEVREWMIEAKGVAEEYAPGWEKYEGGE